MNLNCEINNNKADIVEINEAPNDSNYAALSPNTAPDPTGKTPTFPEVAFSKSETQNNVLEMNVEEFGQLLNKIVDKYTFKMTE